MLEISCGYSILQSTKLESMSSNVVWLKFQPQFIHLIFLVQGNIVKILFFFFDSWELHRMYNIIIAITIQFDFKRIWISMAERRNVIKFWLFQAQLKSICIIFCRSSLQKSNKIFTKRMQLSLISSIRKDYCELSNYFKWKLPVLLSFV